MMKKEIIRKVSVYSGIILLFAVLAYGFTPQVLGGKIVNQSDISAWQGMAHEAITHNEANPDDPTAWTGSMFSGMPTTAVVADFKGDWTEPVYEMLLAGKRPASYLFLALIGGFLLMLSMGINGIVAVGGAIAIAFCSYNMQIIQVGHNTKMLAIAFFPWVLAGIIYTYRAALAERDNWKEWLPKTILGSVLFSFALSMQIKANHIQITYYLAIVIFIYAIGLFISLCISEDGRKKLGRFLTASALLLTVGVLGIATNANKLLPTYEYTPYTMRGGSELTSDKAGHNRKGLDLDYATAWSYGIEEMPNLMIPNFNGGASASAVDPEDSQVYDLLRRARQPNLDRIMKSLPMYWGPQPFTAGPMYLGAISIFLFILGLFLSKGRERWWILAATLIAVMLAWGNHFMWFTRLWFDHVPFYNKFRTVSMALTILQITVPMLGFYVLDHIIKGKYDLVKFRKAGLAAYLLTGGFCLLCWIFPSIAGSFSGSVDNGQAEVLRDALVADRKMIMQKDALRSFILITVTFALLAWGYMDKGKEKIKGGRMGVVAISVILLICMDLLPVGKRYLNKDHFVTKRDFSSQYNPRPVDRMIHEDTDINYRVLDISVNTFNDAIQSYHHKCIGGYSPVKMQRYQDLIERYISPEIKGVYDVVGKSGTIQEVEKNLPEMKITSLLNGKYIILGADYPPIRNQYAKGNCWFVEDFAEASTPDEEIALIGKVDLSRTAVIGEDYAWAREKVSQPSENASITQTYYSPNELRYSYSSDKECAAIFSEIFYPGGWKAWIEPAGQYGKVRNGYYEPTPQATELNLFRADWMLRGAILPAGEHQIVMRFEPDSYRIGKNISRASSITLFLLLIGSVIFSLTASTRRKE